MNEWMNGLSLYIEILIQVAIWWWSNFFYCTFTNKKHYDYLIYSIENQWINRSFLNRLVFTIDVLWWLQLNFYCLSLSIDWQYNISLLSDVCVCVYFVLFCYGCLLSFVVVVVVMMALLSPGFFIFDFYHCFFCCCW